MHLVMHILLFGWIYALLASLVIGLIRRNTDKGRDDNSYKTYEHFSDTSKIDRYFEEEDRIRSAKGKKKSAVRDLSIVKDEEVEVRPPDYDGVTIAELEAMLTADDADVIDASEYEDIFAYEAFCEIDLSYFLEDEA